MTGSNGCCARCLKPLSAPLAPHFCESCGMPQPISETEDYFAALGVERRFIQDPNRLERRFYDISRALHPDRFAKMGGEAMSLSLKRMSLLNQAYRTLKDQDLRRSYLLSLQGIRTDQQGQKGGTPKAELPLEMTELWFELQDALMEEPDGAHRKIAEFKGMLHDELQRQENRIRELERKYDDWKQKSAEAAPEAAGTAASGGAVKDTLLAIAKAIQLKSYLSSMGRDVERIRAKLGESQKSRD